jgi:hypothetical protein
VHLETGVRLEPGVAFSVSAEKRAALGTLVEDVADPAGTPLAEIPPPDDWRKRARVRAFGRRSTPDQED